MSKQPILFKCKKCGELKPLEGFYTNSNVDKNKPYQLVCRKCYQITRRAREQRAPVRYTTIKNSDNTTDRNPLIRNPAPLSCTVKQFHEFLGPKIRNDIQTLTKREKKRLNHICQHCGNKEELEAAHIKGNDRKQIIDLVLCNYRVEDNPQVIKVDLNRVLDEIIEAHQPINEHFLFLCGSCHRRYDKES